MYWDFLLLKKVPSSNACAPLIMKYWLHGMLLKFNWKKEFRNKRLEPPRELKSRIFSEIGREKSPITHSTPAKPSLVPRIGFAKYVAAASVILLAGSVLLNFYLLSQYKKTIAKNEELIAAQTQVANTNKVLQTKMLNYENAISLMQNPLMTDYKNAGCSKESGTIESGNSILEHAIQRMYTC